MALSVSPDPEEEEAPRTEPFVAPPTPEEIRADLERRPRPNKSCFYDRSNFLDSSLSSGGVGTLLPGPPIEAGRSSLGCSAGLVDRVAGDRSLGNLPVLGRVCSRRKEEGRCLLQEAKASNPHLLRERFKLCRRRGGRFTSGAFSLVSPRGLCSNLGDSARQESNQQWESFTDGRRKDFWRGAAHPGSRCWPNAHIGRREATQCPEKAGQTQGFFCRSLGKAIWTNGSRYPSGCPGWHWWYSASLKLTTSGGPDRREEGSGSGRQHHGLRGGAQEEAEARPGEYPGKSSPTTCSSGATERGEEHKETIQESKPPEEEKGAQEPQESFRLPVKKPFQPSLPLERVEHDGPAEASLKAGAGLGLSPPGGAGNGAAGGRWSGRGRVRSGRFAGAETQTAHLLSATASATTRPQVKGQQRAGDAFEELGSSEAGPSVGAGRWPGCATDSRGCGHPSGLEHSQTPRGPGGGGRHKRSPTYIVERAETRSTSGEGRWKRVMAQTVKLAVQRLGGPLRNGTMGMDPPCPLGTE